MSVKEPRREKHCQACENNCCDVNEHSPELPLQKVEKHKHGNYKHYSLNLRPDYQCQQQTQQQPFPVVHFRIEFQEGQGKQCHEKCEYGAVNVNKEGALYD